MVYELRCWNHKFQKVRGKLLRINKIASIVAPLCGIYLQQSYPFTRMFQNKHNTYCGDKKIQLDHTMYRSNWFKWKMEHLDGLEFNAWQVIAQWFNHFIRWFLIWMWHWFLNLNTRDLILQFCFKLPELFLNIAFIIYRMEWYWFCKITWSECNRKT
jgi:hypothetical protein